ncbi:TIGR03619 family F420-dependent LLM class oxidoreductase [Candidatus Bathyarchaeota archaeon]|nr:MAG: TIGR03619 family F420-dependent LLM class oxidoreductase [Candidatus Bathyarchaeota archaeon]
MKLGVCVPNYGESCSVEALRTVAAEAEKQGYDSIWCTDHVLMPKNSGTPYEKIFESVTTLAYLAATTNRLRLGISSLITPMRNPVVVAKQLATIDNLSNGRLIATSAGWNETEFSHLGSNFHNRGKRLDESIQLIKDLWAGKTHFQSSVLLPKFKDAVFEPTPVQQTLSIWIGGSSQAAMKRAATLGDAWHPNVQTFDKFAKLVSEFRESFPGSKEMDICVRIGLNSKSDRSEYTSPLGEKRVMLSSNREENRNIMKRLESLGVSYAVIAPNPDGRVSVADQLSGMKMITEDFL